MRGLRGTRRSKLDLSVAILLGILIALAFVALTWAHHAFWTGYFAPRSFPDEVHNVVTADGWRLGIRRYRPRGDGPRYEEPVILCHGLGANHYNMDWDPPYGLAQALAARGHDCFVLSLRGHHESDRPSLFNKLRWGYSFDDYVKHDIPTAIDHVLEVTGARRAQWVGHSMGGLLAYAIGGTAHERKLAGGVVAVGSPASFAHQRHLVHIAGAGALLARKSRLPQRWITHMVAPFTGHFEPPFSELVISTKSMEPAVVRRLQANAFEDISAGVARQFDDWVRHDAFRTLDRAYDYRESMRAFSVPVLLVGGSKDMMAPPGCMNTAYEVLGSADKTLLVLGKEYGSRCEYGHGDLLLGRAAPDEVFPRIADWLEARATRVV